jgi:hypothetical protein
MSNFVRAIAGVFGVGMIVGAGALMLVPQSSLLASVKVPDPPAKACEQAGCAKTAAAHKETAKKADDSGSLDSVATSARGGATRLVTVDAKTVAALRRGETFEEATAKPAPQPEPQVQPEPVAQPAPPPATGKAARAAGSAKRPAYAANGGQRHTGRQGGSRNSGFAMGNPFFPMFR